MLCLMICFHAQILGFFIDADIAEHNDYDVPNEKMNCFGAEDRQMNDRGASD